MIQVVNRALDIFEFCAKHPEKIYSLSELAAHAGIHRATCSHIVKTLVDRKYIERVGYMKGYRMGSMTYSLTKNFSFRNNLLDLAKPVMKDLCEMLNESVVIAVYNKQENTRVTLHTDYSSHELQVRATKEKNAYDTAIGRLIIAFLSKNDRMTLAQNIGLPSLTVWKEAAASIEDFEQETAKIREKGIAFHTENSEQVIGVAAPIFFRERVIAGLGIYLPVVRFIGDLKILIIDQVTYAAQKISEQLLESAVF